MLNLDVESSDNNFYGSLPLKRHSDELRKHKKERGMRIMNELTNLQEVKQKKYSQVNFSVKREHFTFLA